MKVLVFLFLVGTALSRPEEGSETVLCAWKDTFYPEGAVWDLDCNTCTCRSNGLASCTKMFCKVGCRIDEDTLYAVGDSWTADDGCNTCTCSDTGRALCTMKFCLDDQDTRKEEEGSETVVCAWEDTFYPEGAVWDVDCNTCTCRSNGLASCTKMFCEVGCRIDEDTLYAVGDSWTADDGCNTCTCSDTGRALCTMKFCLDDQDTRKEEEGVTAMCEVDGTIYYAGDSFTASDGCNTCRCTETGVAACTLMMCPGPDTNIFGDDAEEKNKKDSRKEATTNCYSRGRSYFPGDNFIAEDGCNNCVCTSGGDAACTRKACPKTCRYNEQVYMAGDSFPSEDGCNTCTCGRRDGSIACTEMACLPQSDVRMSDDDVTMDDERVEVFCYVDMRTMEPGATWDEGCSTCKCEANGTITCNSTPCCLYIGPRGETKRADLGDSYNNGCSKCRCLEDGPGNAASYCTMKSCRNQCQYSNWDLVAGYTYRKARGQMISVFDEEEECPKFCRCEMSKKRGAFIDCKMENGEPEPCIYY